MYQTSYLLEMNATRFPDRLALVFKDEEISWKTLDHEVDRLARGMRGRGVRKGDVVAYYMRNSCEVVLIWWATQKLGAIAQPINVHMLPHEVAACLNASRCSMLFYENREPFSDRIDEIERLAESLQTVVACLEPCDVRTTFDELLVDGEDSPRAGDIGGRDGSLLLFTSGTTGAPKGVVRSQQVIRDYALMMAIENENVSVSETLVTISPLFHTAGMSLLMKMAALGGTLVLFDRFDAEAILRAIDEYRATQIMLIPPHLYLRLVAARGQKHNLSTVREAQCSGGGVSRDDIEAMHALFPQAKFRFSWDSTETCAPTSAVLSFDELQRRPELHRTIGRLNTLVEMKLVDDQGLEVAEGEVGEAVVRSSMVFSGYMNDEALTARVLDEDGWYFTADLLRRDDEGFYYLVDRKNDMIKTGGENVYSHEVEAALLDYPGIVECAVIGVPDERFGEAVAAVLVTDGADLDGDDLIRYCKEKMASYKKPRYVAYLDALPRNSIGKLQKRDLRDLPLESFQRLF